MRIAQLYPFPHDEFQAQINLYTNASEVVWCQEEPGNQGAWHRIQHYILRHMREDQILGYAMRASSASPAVGYLSLHNEQQKELVDAAFAPLTDNLVLPGAGHWAEEGKGRTMLIEVKVPQLSESVSEATLLAWHKKHGEAVKRDENLIDIETDKVVLELPAPADGVLVSIAERRQGHGEGGRGHRHHRHRRERLRARLPQQAEVRERARETRRRRSARRRAVMPAAQKIAAEKGIDTGAVQGTGRDGRVTKADVLAQAAKSPAVRRRRCSSRPPPVNVEQAARRARPEQRVPMSRLRARIAERLVQSQSTAAILTTFNEVNMQPVMELRKKYQERFEKEHGVKLGFMSFFVKAAVHALKKYPIVNASIDGNDIVYHGYFDIGVAVGSPRGLVVPILRDADQMSLRRHREEDRRLRQEGAGRQARRSRT